MNKKLLALSPLTESTFYILLVLSNPLHGYGIIKEVEVITNDRLTLAAGTLYGVIQNLLKYELIYLYDEDIKNKRKKEYQITEKGAILLGYETKRLREMVRNVRRITNG
ncbi:Transcriptional regulator PadR-like family protein [Candidatus Izimaplasma bacterium HR1]|jgi:DNA-binding PadR family transcriptional regulator|uniref:PadR family transcriptional regulator n=1 Tax=Candidatus Izimoplasma sp. HR1 TaxID=1541959 RepID=UPI0004F8630F|nr:Transcriptional regulator PadR-like family protein [Candidatus Izimaplasma bacterium HR1]